MALLVDFHRNILIDMVDVRACPSLIDEQIRAVADVGIIRSRDLVYRGVVEFVPFPIGIQSGGLVVPAGQHSIMMGHSDEVILDMLVLVICQFVVQLQTPRRDLHLNPNLLAMPPVVDEALEVDDEHIRQLPEVKTLRSTLMLLAARAVPTVVLAQFLILGEQVDAILQRYQRRHRNPALTINEGLAIFPIKDLRILPTDHQSRHGDPADAFFVQR